MKISHVILVAISTVIVSSCVRLPLATVINPPDIIVHVTNAGDASITTPASGKCKLSNQGKPGCIHVGVNETALIKFKRTGPPAWVFSSFKICKMTESGNVCDLNIWERMDFAVTNDTGTAILIPDQSGVVNLTPLGASLDEFLLLDVNTIAQDYYYSVDVCHTGTGVCATADPPVENGGRH